MTKLQTLSHDVAGEVFEKSDVLSAEKAGTDTRIDALVLELRAMRQRVAEVLGDDARRAAVCNEAA